MINKWQIDAIGDDSLVLLFPKNTAEIDARVSLLKTMVMGDVERIIAVASADRTFENTAQALDDISKQVQRVAGPLHILSVLSTEKNIRDITHERMIELSIFLQKHVAKNVDLFKSFKDYCEQNAPKESLNDEQHYYLKETLKSFERSGLLLPAKQLEQVRALVDELDKLGLEFERAINDVDTKLYFTKQDLAGIPDVVFASLKKDEQNRYIVSLDYPTVFAVLKHAQRESTRKQVLQVFENRAYPANYERLREIIIKRDQLARLLKFATYAEYDLDDQMAKNPETVIKFIDGLMLKAHHKGPKEAQELLALIETEDSRLHKISPWNFAYLKEQYRVKYFNIDTAKLAEYFPVDHVVTQVLDLYSNFLGLSFEPLVVTGLWHESVRILKVYDSNHVLRGYLLLDLYPRPNKYSHACISPVVSGIKVLDSIEPAVAVMIANLSPGTKGVPGLLNFEEVKTFFHEFGHAMHEMLGATRMCAFSGLHTKYDFIEVPSQMFEEWLYDREVLKKLGKHYKTGELLPDELIKQLQHLIRFDIGDFVLRQSALSKLSLGLFSGADKNIQSYYKQLMQQARPYIIFDDNLHMPASFGHLVGYDAKYYSYLWSKVYAIDLFTTIKQRGLFSQEVGKDFAEKVLSKGGSVEPEDLLHNFLGRKPDQKAFLHYYGL